MEPASEGLSAEQIHTASDPISCRDLFWNAMARGESRVAKEAALRLVVPEVTTENVEGAFAFSQEALGDESKAGEDESAAEDEGALALMARPVEPDTPSAVKSFWNHGSDVGVILVDFEAMCLCRLDTGTGLKDFRACSRIGCDITIHHDTQGKKPKVRLLPSNSGGVVAIKCPVISTKSKKGLFARPTLNLDDFPASLRALNRHDILSA